MLWEPKVTDVVCSQHVQESDFYYPGIRKLLKNDAVPSVKKSSNVTNLDLPSIQRPPRRESKENENVRLKNRLAKQRDQLRNTKKREKRLRLSVNSLISDLQQEKLINADLRAQLDDYKGE